MKVIKFKAICTASEFFSNKFELAPQDFHFQCQICLVLIHQFLKAQILILSSDAKTKKVYISFHKVSVLSALNDKSNADNMLS